MELPILRLTVDKGPRKGETLECKPGGALFRVGRVIRGNALAVRDPGVSQKHLAFEFLFGTSRWAVSDLESSNGTVVNGDPIPPSIPFPLSDGDTIKIGDATCIAVSIVRERCDFGAAGEAAAEKEEGVRRRGRPRKGAAPPMPVGPVVEDTGVVAATKAGRARGRQNKVEILKPVVEEEEDKRVADKGRARGRRPETRASTAKALKENEEVEKLLAPALVSDSEALNVAGNGNTAIDGDGARDEAKNDGHGEREEKVPGKGEEEGTVEEMVVDMDNMTLEEWFDRMEKFLPKVINDAAEEIIASLWEKAQHFNEFIAKSSNDICIA